MKIFWFIPTHGDGRYLGTAEGGRNLDFDYLQQVAIAADSQGFYGVLLPTGRSCEDAWVVASSLIPATNRLRFLVALRPGLVSPTLAARMCVTFDRLSGGRLLINVVTGGDPVELAGDGVFLNHDERYEVTDEFLTVWRGLLSGNPKEVNFEGRHLRVQGASTLIQAVQRPYPPLYFGGSSPAGIEIGAKHVDVYLTWGEPPAQVAAKIADVRAAAEKAGRTVRFGIRLHVIVRETEEEAWTDAARLVSRLDQRTIERAQRRWSGKTRTASGACSPSRPQTPISREKLSRSARICGLASALSAAEPAPLSWVALRRWPRAFRNTTSWASKISFFPGTRTWKKPIAWPNCFFRVCRSGTAIRRGLRLLLSRARSWPMTSQPPL